MRDVSDFLRFMRDDVIPLKYNNPDWRRLDGEISGGNRTVFGRFIYNGEAWVVHADSHFEPLQIAYDAAQNRGDPFKEVQIESKQGRCLTLTDELRSLYNSPFKHLYIYSWSKSR